MISVKSRMCYKEKHVSKLENTNSLFSKETNKIINSPQETKVETQHSEELTPSLLFRTYETLKGVVKNFLSFVFKPFKGEE